MLGVGWGDGAGGVVGEWGKEGRGGCFFYHNLRIFCFTWWKARFFL